MLNLPKISVFALRNNILSKPLNKVLKINNTSFDLRYIKDIREIKAIININKIRTISSTTITHLKEIIKFSIKDRR